MQHDFPTPLAFFASLAAKKSLLQPQQTGGT